MREEKLYRTGKAAGLLGIHLNTLKRWIYAGKIKATKTLGGEYRIPEGEIRRLLGQSGVSSSGQGEDLGWKEMTRSSIEDLVERIKDRIAEFLEGEALSTKELYDLARIVNALAEVGGEVGEEDLSELMDKLNKKVRKVAEE